MTHPIQPAASTTPFKDAFNNVDYPTPVMVPADEIGPMFERADAEIAALRAEVTRLRARVRVEAGDVARVVTREQVTAWARCFGISFDENGDFGDAWQTAAALIIAMRADDCSGQWRILDEMAATPLESDR
jgi:hypothetical protein